MPTTIAPTPVNVSGNVLELPVKATEPTPPDGAASVAVPPWTPSTTVRRWPERLMPLPDTESPSETLHTVVVMSTRPSGSAFAVKVCPFTVMVVVVFGRQPPMMTRSDMHGIVVVDVVVGTTVVVVVVDVVVVVVGTTVVVVVGGGTMMTMGGGVSTVVVVGVVGLVTSSEAVTKVVSVCARAVEPKKIMANATIRPAVDRHLFNDPPRIVWWN